MVSICVRVVPVLSRMLKLSIVVTLRIYRSQRRQGTSSWRGKPGCPRKAGADPRHAGGGMNIGSMGSIVSASENTALNSLLELADGADARLTKGDISGLLLWCRRRKLITMDQLFDPDSWHRIGMDLWDSVQVGNKEARQLAPLFRTVKNMIADMKDDATVAAAAARAVYAISRHAGEYQEPCTAPHVYPVHPSETEFWGGPSIELGDWAPAPPTAPPLPENVPLPDSDFQEMDTDSPEGATLLLYPKIHKSELTDTLRKQQDQMTKLLDKMQRLDKGSRNTTIKQAYRKAHQAIMDGLQAVEQQICGESGGMGEVISGGSNNGSINESAPAQHSQRHWVKLMLEDGEIILADADHYLRSKYGKGVGDDEREAWKRGVKWREQGGGASGVQNPDCVHGGCGLQEPGGTEWGCVATGCRSGDGKPRYATLILI